MFNPCDNKEYSEEELANASRILRDLGIGWAESMSSVYKQMYTSTRWTKCKCAIVQKWRQELVKVAGRNDENFGTCIVCNNELPARSFLYCSKKCNLLMVRLRDYHLTVADYIRMETIQNHACAICGHRNVNLVIDHDHETGKIRELLCSNCNTGLGMFKDDPRRLAAALVYLEDHT